MFFLGSNLGAWFADCVSGVKFMKTRVDDAGGSETILVY